MKYLGKSQYKYVSKQLLSGKVVWRGTFFRNGKGNGKSFPTEREAAIYVDKKMLENGKEPVNILKKMVPKTP